ncbi:phosphoenolpyruvate--protein phosphotransferase [Magnetospirillum fulvum]|jgi:phosphotransferase system enzyme I (PtsI)|uniref:Phosphoenolpyruvate-protein phosphotransferase n=1 Tax=Magnetospirillum fulvum MGU-K5 TaxID=1316936 RepID=S9SAT4_MAGFU|nr:phosphoenolpyruvate--protein phosphotransferase [Magnetospirillum fulvum]EPY01153.1 phosphoenolpyruvate-protein kinase [Magnetospirillum fulvum MGU-K5]
MTIRAAEDEIVLEGLAIARGVAIGVVFPHDAGTIKVPERRIESDQVADECARFTEAVASAARQVESLQEKAVDLGGAAAEEMGYLLDAYRQMLKGSRLTRGVQHRIAEKLLNAEAAVQQEIAEIVRGFEAMEDAYLAARVADIKDIGRRLLRSLTHTPYRPFTDLPRNAVILAEEMTPADTALLNPRRVAGLATVVGGAESHTAIMARSLGLPTVLGVSGLLRGLRGGEPIIVDGTGGVVVINPSATTMAHYRKKRADCLRARRALARLRDVPAETRDGTRILLQANMELPAEVASVLESGAEGIGLLRSEFMYMNRDDVPSEDEQYQLLRELIERLGGRRLTVRTFDAGGDKLAPALGCSIGPNPALGLRAIRLGLARPELLETQLSAILRASAHGPVRILIPMVATVEELRTARRMMESALARLIAAGVPVSDPPPPLGAMIEIPGAALAADALAAEADFFAIGTNDLTQYTLAIDRSDEAVAHLFNPLHPAVLRLIQFSADAAAKAGIPLCVCGEMAGDPRYTALLLGLGIRDLSMSTNNLPMVKQRIHEIDQGAAELCARAVMAESDSARIAQLVDSCHADGRCER